MTMSETSSPNRLADGLESLAIGLVLVPASIIVVTVAGFALGHGIGWATLPLGAILALLSLHAFVLDLRKTLMVGLTVSVLSAGAGFTAAAFPDGSWDGLAYQQEGVLRLAAGWNPLTEDARRYGQGADLYVNHYPKGGSIPAASVASATGRLEAGKLFNLTLAVAAFAMASAALLQLTALRPGTALLLGALAALNPVFVGQALTFYVDGMLAELLAVLVAALALWIWKPNWRLLAIACVAVCLIINVKFTGIGYAGALVAVATLVVWRRHGTAPMIRFASAGLLAAVVGFAVIGYAPYVLNTVEKGGPFYPISPAPPDRADSLVFWRPVNLFDRDRVTRFLVSNFSESESVRPPRSSQLKIPFSLSASERTSIYGPDLEVGGFGPLFGGALILVAVSAAALLLTPATRSAAVLALLITGGLFASVLMHSETWWARFVPQAWLMLIPVSAVGLSLSRRSAQWWLAATCVLVALANAALTGASAVRLQFAYRQAVEASLEEIGSAPQPISVYLDTFPPLRRRLQEAGIQFTIVHSPPKTSANARAIPAPGNQAFWYVSSAAQ